ncbi:MAG TPA: VWA domain-containing protein, partial [Candidatus Limnocylindria bacterium]|nr:VWA domain-containing protein [Candidatus Limnocylindria bacterium]
MTIPPIGLARPELLWLLAVAPLLAALVVLAARAGERSARAFAGEAGLSARSRLRFWLKSALLVLAFSSLVVALAGPYVDLRVRGARRLGVDLVLAIDISQSMATRDVEPDRLRAARRLAQDLGERLIGSRVSLVLFAGNGTLRYPATTDPKILGEVLDNSGKGVRLQQGSSLAAAVESSLAAFPLDADPKRGRGIVVVSDGEITLGAAPDVATLVARGIKLYTVGVGTTRGGQIPTYDDKDGKFTGYLRGPDGVAITSRLDEAGLQKLAAAANGRYWRFAGEDSVIADIARELRTLEAIEPVENAGSIPDERSQLFVGIAAALVLVERLLSDRRRMPSPRRERPAARPRRGRRVLGIAIGSALLWSVACGESEPTIADANRAFNAGDYTKALAAYRDLQKVYPDAPQLSIDAGNSLHMLNDHVRALPDYAKAIDVGSIEIRAIAQYDRGNTLFRLGRLEDARDAYRESLRLDADDRQAKFNLELVQRLLDARQRGQNPQPGDRQPGASGSPGGQG